MRKKSNIIYLILLCSLAFTASANGVMCVCDMSDIIDTQQSPVDKTSNNCHIDQDMTLDEQLNSRYEFM